MRLIGSLAAVWLTVKADEPANSFDNFWSKLKEGVEIVNEGIGWAEGPVWSEKYNSLFFASPTDEGLYRLSWENEFEVLLDNAGQPDAEKQEWGFENGANGVSLHPTDPDVLFVNQHGSRSMSKYNIATGELTPFLTEYEGMRFNSPNDFAIHENYLYFTDPPYGMLEKDRESVFASLLDMDTRDRGVHRNEMWKEDGTVIRGVFRVDISDPDWEDFVANEGALKKPEAQMVIDNIQRPNGIAVDPVGKRLFVVESCQANQCFQEGRVHVYDITGSEKAEDALEFVKTITFVSDFENGICDGTQFLPHSFGPYMLVACWGVVAINYETLEAVDFHDIGFRVSNVEVKYSKPQAVYFTGAGKVGRLIIDGLDEDSETKMACSDVDARYKNDPSGKAWCNSIPGCKAKVKADKWKMQCKAERCAQFTPKMCSKIEHCFYSSGQERCKNSKKKN